MTQSLKRDMDVDLRGPVRQSASSDTEVRESAVSADPPGSEAQDDRCSVAASQGGSASVRSAVQNILSSLGVVGESDAGFLVYLTLTSRLLPDPVSLAIKGTSSSGKSFLVENVLKLFPQSAAVVRTAMSDRALVYTDEDFQHRTLVLFEADAMASGTLSYLIRSLLSEKRLSYETTVRLKDGQFGTQKIVKPGPTNLVLTTTAIRLHPENETRMLGLTMRDDPEQTRRVLLGIARRAESPPDLSRWLSLQERLQDLKPTASVPYSQQIAENTHSLAPR
ncbi:MAG: hypothetical protein K8H90_05145, partial [Thermoanaerobaculia bacterium]|nr:hypothetical protein [Thermoanaerobaculia bacterium]